MIINRSPMIWVGGKWRLVEKLFLLNLVPPNIDTYYEPFLGGATLAINFKARTKHLSDFNDDLINLYERIQSTPESIIRNLDAIKAKQFFNTEEGYLNLRDRFNRIKAINPNSLQTAILFLYLNAKGFQGLCRYNKSGGFNVPPHKPGFEKRKFPETSEIMRFSKQLSGDVLFQSDFRYLSDVQFNRDDFVILDPPYIPTSTTSNFTNYTGSDFSETDHQDVESIMRDLTKRRVRCMAFNSNSEATLSLYRGYRRYKVPVTRSLGSKCSTMGTKIFEIVITNYDEKFNVESVDA